MAKENTQSLFEESSRGAVSAITAVFFVLSIVLSMGGIVLMSYGFNSLLGGVAERATTELWLFAGGLASATIGFALPFTVLPKLGK